jgi:hypothetical protein
LQRLFATIRRIPEQRRNEHWARHQRSRTIWAPERIVQGISCRHNTNSFRSSNPDAVVSEQFLGLINTISKSGMAPNHTTSYAPVFKNGTSLFSPQVDHMVQLTISAASPNPSLKISPMSSKAFDMMNIGSFVFEITNLENGNPAQWIMDNLPGPQARLIENFDHSHSRRLPALG